MNTRDMCHCGKPLHYTDPKAREFVDKMIAAHGEKVRVKVRGRTWLVPRHYIALHGLQARELPRLGFQEILK